MVAVSVSDTVSDYERELELDPSNWIFMKGQWKQDTSYSCHRSCVPAPDQTASVISRLYFFCCSSTVASHILFAAKFDCRWSKANALKNAKLNLPLRRLLHSLSSGFSLAGLSSFPFAMNIFLNIFHIGLVRRRFASLFSRFSPGCEKHIKTHLGVKMCGRISAENPAGFSIWQCTEKFVRREEENALLEIIFEGTEKLLWAFEMLVNKILV